MAGITIPPQPHRLLDRGCPISITFLPATKASALWRRRRRRSHGGWGISCSWGMPTGNFIMVRGGRRGGWGNFVAAIPLTPICARFPVMYTTRCVLSIFLASVTGESGQQQCRIKQKEKDFLYMAKCRFSCHRILLLPKKAQMLSRQAGKCSPVKNMPFACFGRAETAGMVPSPINLGQNGGRAKFHLKNEAGRPWASHERR